MGAATAPVSTKTEVFTREELLALRKALNEGRNGMGSYAAPPDEERDESDDWRNDVELLVKFLRDLRDVLSAVIESRLPPQDQRRFRALLENLSPTIDEAIERLQAIDGPTAGLFKVLERLGLVGDAVLAKLDEFRDRIIEGPLVGVLEMGDTILDSLIAAIDILEPLKELKDTIKNKIEYGADGEIIRLNIYPYRERSESRE
jgi:hypothetical protein